MRNARLESSQLPMRKCLDPCVGMVILHKLMPDERNCPPDRRIHCYADTVSSIEPNTGMGIFALSDTTPLLNTDQDISNENEIPTPQQLEFPPLRLNADLSTITSSTFGSLDDNTGLSPIIQPSNFAQNQNSPSDPAYPGINPLPGLSADLSNGNPMMNPVPGTPLYTFPTSWFVPEEKKGSLTLEPTQGGVDGGGRKKNFKGY